MPEAPDRLQTRETMLLTMCRPPTASERRQLAIMQTGVALDALRAGDLGAAQLFLADAIDHLRAARGVMPVTERHGLRVVGDISGMVK